MRDHVSNIQMPESTHHGKIIEPVIDHVLDQAAFNHQSENDMCLYIWAVLGYDNMHVSYDVNDWII